LVERDNPETKVLIQQMEVRHYFKCDQAQDKIRGYINYIDKNGDCQMIWVISDRWLAEIDKMHTIMPSIHDAEFRVSDVDDADPSNCPCMPIVDSRKNRHEHHRNCYIREIVNLSEDQQFSIDLDTQQVISI